MVKQNFVTRSGSLKRSKANASDRPINAEEEYRPCTRTDDATLTGDEKLAI